MIKIYEEREESNGRADKIVSDLHWQTFKIRNDSIIVDLMHG
jgi:hypothetical protein